MSPKKAKKLDDSLPDSDLTELESRVPDAEEKARVRQEKRRQINQEFAGEIEALRTQVVEMTEHYKLKVDAQLVQLATFAQGHLDAGGKAKVLPRKTVTKMLERLRKLEIKSDKGRAKDFQRLQDGVAELVDLLPPEA